MFTCVDCNLFFPEASGAFRHLAVEHEHADKEQRLKLEALLDWQIAHYVEMPDAQQRETTPVCCVGVGSEKDWILGRPARPCGNLATHSVRIFKDSDEFAPMCSDHASEGWNVGD
jgi:hypothetical protein